MKVKVTALKADGHAYRWWWAEVESETPELVVALTRAGDQVYQPTGTWVAQVGCRFHFWPDRWYNLVEVYNADGTPDQLYVHVASPARRTAEGIEYCDYELDVVTRVGQPPEVIDQDEFVAAISQYGYSAELQAACHRAAAEAVALVETWQWPGAE